MNDSNPLNRALAAAELAKEQRQTQKGSTSAEQTSKSHTDKPSDNYLNKIHMPSSMTESQASNMTSNINDILADSFASPAIAKVDISIAGVPHRISCPSTEVANLNKTADQINEALRDIRRNVRGKSPSNEELLVLHCLDLYDEIRELSKAKETHLIETQRATALIDKIIKDAVSIL